MNGEPVRLGEIDRLELGSGIHEVRNEGNVSSQSVQLGNDEGGSVDTARCKRFRKPRAVCTSSAFDLGVFGDQFAAAA
jgi:hypothetical protein